MTQYEIDHLLGLVYFIPINPHAVSPVTRPDHLARNLNRVNIVKRKATAGGLPNNFGITLSPREIVRLCIPEVSTTYSDFTTAPSVHNF